MLTYLIWVGLTMAGQLVKLKDGQKRLFMEDMLGHGLCVFSCLFITG